MRRKKLHWIEAICIILESDKSLRKLLKYYKKNKKIIILVGKYLGY